eukprot:UN26383
MNNNYRPPQDLNGRTIDVGSEAETTSYPILTTETANCNALAPDVEGQQSCLNSRMNYLNNEIGKLEDELEYYKKRNFGSYIRL